MPITPDMIVEALRGAENSMRAPAVLARLRALFPNEALGRTPLQSIRARLQENSSNSGQFTGRRDLFERVSPVEERQGLWILRGGLPGGPSLNEPQGGDDSVLDEAEVDLGCEGRAALRSHVVRERSRNLIRLFKAGLDHYRCCVCNFDFGEIYGELGAEFIEAHHINPIAQGERRAQLNELVAVCSNCHRMIHRNGLMAWEQLRQAIQR